MAKKKSDDQTSDGEDETYEEEPNFDDPEGFVDDISDEGEYMRNTSAWWQSREVIFTRVTFTKVSME